MQPHSINMADNSRIALSLTPNSFTLRSDGADDRRMSMALELGRLWTHDRRGVATKWQRRIPGTTQLAAIPLSFMTLTNGIGTGNAGQGQGHMQELGHDGKSASIFSSSQGRV